MTSHRLSVMAKRTIAITIMVAAAGSLWLCSLGLFVGAEADFSYVHGYGYGYGNSVYDNGDGDGDHATSTPASTPGKKISFPKDAKLVIKPSLEIPILEDKYGPKGQEFKTFMTTFKLELPIEIKLDKLGEYAINSMTNWGNNYLAQYPLGRLEWMRRTEALNSVFPRSPSSSKRKPKPNWSTPLMRLINSNQTQIPSQSHYYGYKYRPKRAITDQAYAYDDRFHVLTKLESVLESIGWAPGQACLQRAICELHEYFTARSPGQFNFGGYGLVGEIAMLLLSVSKTSTVTQNALQGHLDAERAGVAGNCSNYMQLCNKSVFR